jgi:membrane-bound lytic murein transglycosylase F
MQARLYTTLARLLALVAALAACSDHDRLQQIRERGELVVVTRNSPTTYYQDQGEDAGFEYQLVKLLAEDLGVELRVQPAFSLDDIFTALTRGDADLAAAGLTLTGEREARYAHSAPYATIRPLIIYKAGQKRPRSIDDLDTLSLVVLAGSSHASAMAALRETGFPWLEWEEIDGVDSMALLDLVDSGYADAAVLDSNEFSVQQSLYPRLKVGFELGSEQRLVWYLAGNGDASSLQRHINDFLSALQQDGSLARLEDIHFGHADTVSRVGSHTFALNMRSRLPQYRDLIREVAEEYQLDWHLLAAIAYQESHWDPEAESPTGVQGMMMLTTATAREVGVKNRTDPRESLRGGARYFKNMKRRLPRDILEPDRTWLALAAYNIGLGHLEDGRVLTERRGGDPHLWQDLMKHLPLLQKSPYYLDTRYGYARGQEAVTYVQNIRHYYNILQWQDIPEQQQQPPLALDAYLPDSLRHSPLRAL